MNTPELPEKFIKGLKKRGFSLVPVPVGALFPGEREGMHVRSYHLTFFKNLPSVRSYGLVPRFSEVRRFGFGAPGVYLVTHKGNLIEMLHEREYPKEVRDGKEPVIILKVMVPLATPSMEDPESPPGTFVVFTPIPPFLITPIEVWLKDPESAYYFPLQGKWREEMEGGWEPEMRAYLTSVYPPYSPMPSIAEQIVQWEKSSRLLKED